MEVELLALLRNANLLQGGEFEGESSNVAMWPFACAGLSPHVATTRHNAGQSFLSCASPSWFLVPATRLPKAAQSPPIRTAVRLSEIYHVTRFEKPSIPAVSIPPPITDPILLSRQ